MIYIIYLVINAFFIWKGENWKNYFSTHIFLIEIFHLKIYIGTHNFKYSQIRFIWREPCLRFFI